LARSLDEAVTNAALASNQSSFSGSMIDAIGITYLDDIIK
jgi:hypothetical protein